MSTLKKADCHFNPRPHEEGDPRASAKYVYPDISIHALTRRATHECAWYTVFTNTNFNPRPHEEGDHGAAIAGRTKKRISIHALTRRATLIFATFKGTKAISIHALTRRATIAAPAHENEQKISIHALTRRAT